MTRVLACLVLMVQAAVPAGAALADTPVLSTAHQAHLSSQGDADCAAVHDQHCLLCRVLSAHPLASAPPVPGAAHLDLLAEGPAATPDPIGTGTHSLLHARAPPSA